MTSQPSNTVHSASCLEWAVGAYDLVTQWCVEVTGLSQMQAEQSLVSVFPACGFCVHCHALCLYLAVKENQRKTWSCVWIVDSARLLIASTRQSAIVIIAWLSLSSFH